MKRFLKLMVNAVAVLMISVACLSLTACGEDVKNAKLELQIYNHSEAAFIDDNYSYMNVDLYAHLAPKTCEAMVKYINEGYYNDAIIYQLNNNIMFGDLVLKGDALEILEGGKVVNIEQNAVKPTLPGEFEAGGTVGSNLKNEKGSVGLWRTYSAAAGSFTTTSGTKTGRATWFMPTATTASYNGYYCVFGKIDLENEDTSAVFTTLNSTFADRDNYTSLVIYFTGEYDANKPDQNHGLTFNCVTSEYFNELPEEEKEQIFVAEGSQLVCYNQYTIKVANNGNGKCGAIVKGATVK
ncbi:MAG: peptidylprolyl isomerase [Clostridia bacterium]|nr:peptidylprolyl isomerase [Clostridia bacterium]